MLPSHERQILIVDDDEHVLSALRRCLATEGYKIFLAREPQAALAILRSRPIDIIMADHIMPNMTGLEFLKMVRVRYPDSIRIMLTGQADTNVAIDALNHADVYRLITKPWDSDMLKMILRGAFEQLELDREVRRLLVMAREADRSTAHKSEAAIAA